MLQKIPDKEKADFHGIKWFEWLLVKQILGRFLQSWVQNLERRNHSHNPLMFFVLEVCVYVCFSLNKRVHAILLHEVRGYARHSRVGTRLCCRR